jgi:hypothetical protein
MTPDNLLEWTLRRPFIPFRLHVSDGTVYEIRHPELCMPTWSVAVIGLPREDTQPVADRIELVALGHIVRLEPLIAAPTGG